MSGCVRDEEGQNRQKLWNLGRQTYNCASNYKAISLPKSECGKCQNQLRALANLTDKSRNNRVPLWALGIGTKKNLNQ